MDQEAQIGAEFFFRCTLGRRAYDESARGVAALMGQNPLQPLALFVGCNLAAHAHVRDRRHEDKEPPRQSNVAGDARALLGDRLLGNLHQDFLPRLQQIGNDRQIRGLCRCDATVRALPADVRPALHPSAISTSAPCSSATVAALRCLAVAGRLSPCGGCLFFLVLFAFESLFTLLRRSCLRNFIWILWSR